MSGSGVRQMSHSYVLVGPLIQQLGKRSSLPHAPVAGVDEVEVEGCTTGS